MPYKIMTKTSEKWEEQATKNLFKLNQNHLYEECTDLGIPEVYSDDFIPEELIPFNMCKKMRKEDQHKTVHFYIDDYHFESLWSKPNRYLNILKFYNGVICPDFSVYEVQPKVMNMWNVYRNRWLARYLQEQGIKVILDVSWADPSTYDYCFSGIEKYSPICVSTVGTRLLSNRQMFIQGFEELIRRVEPVELFVYGEYMPVDFSKYCDHVHYYDSYWKQVRNKRTAN